MSNTKKEGTINFLIYKKRGDSMYTAVCLEFDIVEQGKDLEELKKSIEEAALLHLESVHENKLSDRLLNRSAPQKYWKELFEGLTAYENSLKEKQFPQANNAVRDIWNRNPSELAVV